MNITKRSKYIAAAALALGITTAGIGVVQAASSAQGTNPMSNLVTAIAQKFNLSSSDVQAVVDQTMETERAARETQMQQEQATRLAEAVAAGKITQAQADLITAKQTEMRTSMESMKNMTQEERKTAMETQMTALKQWATDNSIPKEYLFMLGGRGGKGHGGPGRGFGGPGMMNPDQTQTTQTQSTTQN